MVGKELVCPQPSRPNYSDFITYSETDLHLAEGTVAIGCRADLVSHSVVTRYGPREFGEERLFRPAVTRVRRVQQPLTFAPGNEIMLMFTRASNKQPMFDEVLHLCLRELVQTLIQGKIRTTHFPVVDAERPCNNIHSWYRVLTDYFKDNGNKII